MQKKAQDFKNKVSAHIDDIWVNEPKDIFLLKNGYAPSGAGLADQFFTTTVMLSGEVRALGVNIFPRLLDFSKSGDFTLPQMKRMIVDFLRTDCGVVGYFGLRVFGSLLVEFRDLSQEIDSMEDMSALLSEMFTLSNRYQMWMHQIFPWYLCIHFPKLHQEELEKLLSEVKSDPGFTH